MNPSTGLEDPPRRGILDRVSCLIGNGRLRGLEGLADARRQGGIDQQTPRHPQQQRHEPRGFFERARRGQKAWIVEEPTAAFGRLLAFVARADRLGGYLGVGELVRGEDATTLLGHERLTRGDRRREGARNLLDPLGGSGAWARSAPLMRARRGTNRPLQHRGGAQAGRPGVQGLLGLGCPGKRGAAACLERVAGVGTLLA
jgi:hypothetical protein